MDAPKVDQRSGLALEMITKAGTRLPLLVMDRRSHRKNVACVKVDGKCKGGDGHWDVSYSNYLQVAHRVVWFREEHPDWSITTEEIEKLQSGCVMRASIIEPSGRLIASAIKQETASDWGDYREKAETGAIGRALALCGYGTAFAPEFDEGERIADAPTSAKRQERSNTGVVQNMVAKLKDADLTPQEAAGLMVAMSEVRVAQAEPVAETTEEPLSSSASPKPRKARGVTAPPTPKPNEPSGLPAALRNVLLENAKKVGCLAEDGETMHVTKQIAETAKVPQMVRVSDLTTKQAQDLAALLFTLGKSGDRLTEEAKSV